MMDVSYYDEDFLREIAKNGDIKKLEYLSSIGVDVFKKDGLGKSAFDYITEQDLSKEFTLIRCKTESIKKHLDNISNSITTLKRDTHNESKNIIWNNGNMSFCLLLAQVILLFTSISIMICASDNDSSIENHNEKHIVNQNARAIINPRNVSNESIR